MNKFGAPNPWITFAAACALALACAALSAAAPSILSRAIIWTACELQCSKWGWPAIEYSAWVSFVAVAIMVACAGRLSYNLANQWGAVSDKTLNRLYAVGGGACIALMIFAPFALPEVAPGLIERTTIRAFLPG